MRPPCLTTGSSEPARTYLAILNLSRVGTAYNAPWGDRVRVPLQALRRRRDVGGGRQRGVERYGDARRLTRVGMDPVIEPTRKYHQQPRLRSNPEGLAVWVARRGYSLHRCPRIEKLQYTTERLIRAAASGIHVIHPGPCAVRMGVGRMVRPCPADGRPGGNQERTLERVRTSRCIDDPAQRRGQPRRQCGNCRLSTAQEIGTRVPAADIASAETRVVRLLREDQRLQVPIHPFGVRHPRAADESRERMRDLEFHTAEPPA